MAQYTTELRTLIENGFDIGLNDYPIFDETYRPILNKKIIEHYYVREIGAETAGLFKLYLNRRMYEIMPYYNKMYQSELLEFNPLEDFQKTETIERGLDKSNAFDGAASDSTTETGAATSTETSTGNGLNVESDTPQGMLSIGDIKTNTYATKADMYDNSATSTAGTNTTGSKTGSGESHTTSSENQSEWIEKHLSGKQGSKSYSEMLIEFRKTFLNIDMMIIKELSNLFMLIY